VSDWLVPDTEDDHPPLRIWRRSEIDELTARRAGEDKRAPSGKTYRQVTPEEAAAMVADYRSGLAIHKIEQAYGRSRPTVKRALREAGIEIRGRRGGTDGLAATG
jgi:hypothetical protein